MLHGLVIDNLSSWYYTLAHPLALVADVYLYDLRGHGRTDMPATGYSVDTNVDDLVALLDQWGIDEPVHLFGNSFGGVVSLALAHRHPERVASLFLIEAHFAVEGWGEHMAGSLALAAFGLDEDAVQAWLAEITVTTSPTAGRANSAAISCADFHTDDPTDTCPRRTRTEQ